MIKIEENKGKTKIRVNIKKGDAGMEIISVIVALADIFGRAHLEEFKILLGILISDEDSPLNKPEKYRERK